MNDIQLLTKAIQRQNELLTKAPAAFNTALPLHGTGGLFSTPGLDQAIVSAHVRPRGIGSVLPAFPSNDTQPTFGIVTGISDDIGSEPTNPCDDAPTGYTTVGALTARFGRVARQTNTIEVSRVIEKFHRGDFTDLVVQGNPFLNPDNGGVAYPSNVGVANFLDAVVYSEMVNAGVRMERKVGRMIWTGTPANNTAGGGYKEFPGLDRQIATGQKDAESGTLIPAADSLVVNAGYATVGSSTFDLVGRVQETEYYVTTLGEDTFGDVQHVVVMRPQMWEAVSEVWPLQYNTQHAGNMLANDANARLIVDGRMTVEARDQMRASRVITINGRTYPVILDNGIHEANGVSSHAYYNNNLVPGKYSSSIYFLPLTAGGLPVLYWQYKDWMQLGSTMSALQNKESFWTDGGRFLWGYVDNGAWCFSLKFATEPRIVLRTPQLAARIDNIVIAPGIKTRDMNPANPHWVGGGVSTRTTPAQSAVWL